MAPKGPSPDEVIDLTGEDESAGIELDTKDTSDTDDEDLREAIALSLQDQAQARNQMRHPDLQSSKSHTDTPKEGTFADIDHGLAASRDKMMRPSSMGIGVLGLDRRQMEAERIARLKRKRNDAVSDVFANIDQSKASALKLQPRGSSSKADSAFQAILPSKDSVGYHDHFSLKKTSPLRFPNGNILFTCGFRNIADDFETISLSDLLRPGKNNIHLRSAFLSSFIVDFDWLFPHFDTKSTSFILALHAANEEHKTALQRDFEGIHNVRLVFPHVGGLVKCMHSKLMLLFYGSTNQDSMGREGEGFCRIVVPTANLVPYDWGAGNIMQNTLFVIDLPEKQDAAFAKQLFNADAAREDTGFQRGLKVMLSAMNVPEALQQKLRKFDFQATKALGFVHTIGGSHPLHQTPESVMSTFFKPLHTAEEGFSQKQQESIRTGTGLSCLAQVLQELGFGFDSKHDTDLPELEMDFVTSSLGNLKADFLQNLASAAHGQGKFVSKTGITKAHAKQKVTNNARDEKVPLDAIKSHFRVYFPSHNTIASSRGGLSAAGTICFSAKWWSSTDTDQFPRDCLRDCIGRIDEQILMHNKIFFVRFPEPRAKLRTTTNPLLIDGGAQDATTNPLYVGWAYVGSANLSESAWGTYTIDLKTKTPKLNCRNWESGVVIPVPVSTHVRRELGNGRKLSEMTLHEVFGDVVPVPFKEPASTYEDGRQPWFFKG